jgi:hypothetical protein
MSRHLPLRSQVLLTNPQTASGIGSMTRQMILNSFDLDHYIENMTSVYDSLLIEESPSTVLKYDTLYHLVFPDTTPSDAWNSWVSFNG